MQIDTWRVVVNNVKHSRREDAKVLELQSLSEKEEGTLIRCDINLQWGDYLIKLPIDPENFLEVGMDSHQRDLLIQALIEMLLGQEERAQSFIMVAYETGTAELVAFDEESAEWSKSVFSTLHPWDGSLLRIKPANKIVATHKVHV